MCSCVQALPTAVCANACTSHTHVHPSKHTDFCSIVNLPLLILRNFQETTQLCLYPLSLFASFFLGFNLPISLCPRYMPASSTAAACWDQAHELPRAGTLLLVHPESLSCSLQVHQPGNSLCVPGCSGVQDQMRRSCQGSHRSRMHMEIKQDMTNIYSWFRWMHKKQLLLGQPQLIQTMLRRGTAKRIFHVLSHPRDLFFRALKCFLLSWKPPPAHLQLLNQPYLDWAELGMGKSYSVPLSFELPEQYC